MPQSIKIKLFPNLECKHDLSPTSISRTSFLSFSSIIFFCHFPRFFSSLILPYFFHIQFLFPGKLFFLFLFFWSSSPFSLLMFPQDLAQRQITIHLLWPSFSDPPSSKAWQKSLFLFLQLPMYICQHTFFFLDFN